MFVRNSVTKFAGTAIVAGALGLAAFAAAGTAAAMSSADDNFLTQIGSVGITYDSPSDAISVAHDVCFAVDDGADPADVAMEILQGNDVTSEQAAMFVVTSVGNYCPEYSVLFD